MLFGSWHTWVLLFLVVGMAVLAYSLFAYKSNEYFVEADDEADDDADDEVDRSVGRRPRRARAGRDEGEDDKGDKDVKDVEDVTDVKNVKDVGKDVKNVKDAQDAEAHESVIDPTRLEPDGREEPAKEAESAKYESRMGTIKAFEDLLKRKPTPSDLERYEDLAPADVRAAVLRDHSPSTPPSPPPATQTHQTPSKPERAVARVEHEQYTPYAPYLAQAECDCLTSSSPPEYPEYSHSLDLGRSAGMVDVVSRDVYDAGRYVSSLSHTVSQTPAQPPPAQPPHESDRLQLTTRIASLAAELEAISKLIR
jgi:hypothetical protein